MDTKLIKEKIRKLTSYCIVCKKEFLKSSPSQVFCSEKCREARYRLTHKDAINEQIRKWRTKNSVKENLKARERYKKNPNPFVEKSMKYRETHRALVNIKRRAYYNAHKKAEQLKQRTYYNANKNK